MMKKIVALCVALLSATLLLAKPYTQQGIAYLYDYKTKTKKPVANVSLTVAYAKGPAVSRSDGTFTIDFQDFGAGKKLAFEKQPFSQGLIVLNKKEVDGWSTFEGKLTLIMCNKRDFDICKQNYYDVGFQSVTQRHEREVAALRRESADYQQRLQELEEKYDRIIDNLRNSADAMARIDQSELDAAMQEVLDLYEQGDVEEAMKKLEDMKLGEKIIQTLDKKHKGERIVAEATEDSILLFNALRTEIDMYKNNGDWDKAAKDLKLLADRLNTYDDIFAYANFILILKDYKGAEIYYEKALKICQRLAEGNPIVYEPKLATTLRNQAVMYLNIQRFTESEKMNKRALEIYQRLAKDNLKAYESDVAMTLHNLANLYRTTQRFTEAEEMYLQALDIILRIAKDNSKDLSDVAMTLNNLANLYRTTKRFTEAEEMYKQTLELYQWLAKDNPKAYEPDVALTLNDLAFLYSDTQQFTEAEEMYKQALEIYQRLAKDNPKAYEPHMAMTLLLFANLYSNTQRFTEAEDMYKQALEINKRLAKDYPNFFVSNLAQTLYNLATLYFDTHRLTEAEEMYKQVLEINKLLAKDYPMTYEPSVAMTLHNLATLYAKAQRNTEAEEIYKQALEIYQRIAKDNPKAYEPDLALTLKNLALLYSYTQQFTEAEEVYKQALEIYQRLAKDNPKAYELYVAQTLGSLSFNTIFLKKFSETEQLAREGLAVDSTKHWIASNLAAAILLQGRYAEAEPIYRQYKDELKDSFLDDFEQFKAAGVIPQEREEDVEKIKRMLEE